MKPDVDNLKTIREALRWVQTEREGDAAHCALDALEAELNAADLSLAAMLQDIGKRDDLIGELRARNDGMADRLGWARRLAPADSPPGDEELDYAYDSGHVSAKSNSADVSHRAGLRAVADFCRARLRSQQPETEEQRAERELKCGLPPVGWSCSRPPGHDGPCAASPVDAGGPAWVPLAEAWLSEHGARASRCVASVSCGFSHQPLQPSRLVACRRELDELLDALAKARDAEGGKS